MQLFLRLIVLALIVLGATPARAEDDFLKSSPGELSTSHASLDNQAKCDTCHEPDRSVSAAKCMSCHEHSDLKRRIAEGRGFHVSSKVKGHDCKQCHKEHRGRGFDPMGWQTVGGTQGFDHRLTGWPLQGKHEILDCQRCHTSKNKQRLTTYL